MAFATLDVADGGVSLTVFPEALKTCGAALRAPGPVIVKGRIDETEKGRVVLVEEIAPLPSVLQGGGGGTRSRAGRGTAGDGTRRHAHACRIRLRAEAPEVDKLLGALKQICQQHRGGTPLFVHVLLPEHEVVVKASGYPVEPDPELVEKIERLLGPDAVTVEYAGRA